MRPEATYNDREFNRDHWFGPFAQFGPEANGRSVGAFDAFPSGHTGAAFAMATVFAKEYSEYKAIPIATYSMAGLVAISRMIEHTHWASDILLGGVMGYLCGKQVFENEKRLFPHYKNQKKKTLSSIMPFNSNGKFGATWSLRF
jgi:hypothetical protein